MEFGGIWSSRPVFLIWTLKEETLLLLLALSPSSLDTSLQLPLQCLCPQIGCLPLHPDIWLCSRNGVCWTEQHRAHRPWQRRGRQLFWLEFHLAALSQHFFSLPFQTAYFTRLSRRTYLHNQDSGNRGENWGLGPKWCVESRSPATLCEVLKGDLGASSLAPDRELGNSNNKHCSCQEKLADTLEGNTQLLKSLARATGQAGALKHRETQQVDEYPMALSSWG